MKKSLKTVKILAAAAFTGTMLIGAPSYGTSIDEAMAEKPIGTPTLDYLKDNNIQIPQVTYNSETSAYEQTTPITSPGSSYTYERVNNAGENSVTMYEYDKTTGETTPAYYNVNLKKTEYGTGDSVKYYSWTTTTDEDGNKERTFGEITTPAETGTTITVKYNDTSTKSYTTEYKDLDYTTTETTGGSYSAHKEIVQAKLQVGEDETTSIDNAIFENNSVTVNYENSSNLEPYIDIHGGALYNKGTIEKITADFVNNSVTNTATNYNSSYRNSYTRGGAIYNEGTIGNIAGDFIGNSASDGGAIYNDTDSTIGNITGDFIGNSASHGGAIFNYYGAVIGDITGNFIGNTANNNGGAIYNYGGNYAKSTIGDITGDFIGNTAQSCGGAIDNFYGIIGNITGDFIGNTAYLPWGGSKYGGAIHNYHSTIGNITGDFIGNTAAGHGAAIYNYVSTIGNITGDFIGNTGYSYYGGAINNYGTIGDITGDFIGNYATDDSTANGGAISNIEARYYTDSVHYTATTIRSITGNFIGNYVKPVSWGWEASGGAIFNNAIIGDITGDFISNYAITMLESSETPNAYGGAIFNDYMIGNITGNFTGNYVNSNNAAGGAIYNYNNTSHSNSDLADIGNITGNFTDNYSQGTNAAYGGAIYNEGVIETAAISNTGKALYNDTNSFGIDSYGYKDGTTDKVYVCSWDNLPTILQGNSQYIALGGSNVNTTKHLVLDDNEYNSLTDEQKNEYVSQGLASSTFDIISKSEYESYKSLRKNSSYYWATDEEIAPYIENDFHIELKSNSATIGEITGDFIGNYAKSDSGEAKGGAIWTNSSMTLAADNSTSTIRGNYVQVGDGEKDYQAIWVDSNTAEITFKAQNNGTINMYDNINGEEGYGVNLTGDSTGTINMYNDMYNAKVTADGDVKVNFANNEIHDYAVHSVASSDATVRYGIDVDLDTKTSDTITTANSSSGVVTLETINFINKDFKDGEYVVQVIKTQTSDLHLALADSLTNNNGIIFKQETAMSDDITTDVNWQDKFTSYTKTKDVYGDITLKTKDTENDSIGVTVTSVEEYNADVQSGDTIKIWGEQATPADENGNEIERNFNFDSSTDTYNVTEDLGNPSAGTLNINGKTDSDGNHSTIDLDGNKGFDLTNETIVNFNNTTVKNGEPIATVENEEAQINVNNSTIDGDIKSTVKYDMTISGDSKITGSVGSADVTVKDGTLSLPNSNTFASSDVTFDGGNLNLINDNTQNLQAQSFTVNQNLKLDIDADLAKSTMDRLPENTTVKNGAMINVDKINLLSDSKTETTTIPFAYDNFKNSVGYIGPDELSKETQVTTAFAPIYKYGVSYNKDDGQFTFLRGAGNSSNSSAAYNPAVLASPVAAQAGATSNVNQTFNYAFQNADNFMNIPYLERVAMKNENKYALSPTGDATDVGTFSPLFVEKEHSSVWVKPYASFENIPLKNGPKVSNITYGTLVGYDSEMQHLKKGWDRVWTGYMGYNGASQRYSGVDSTQNGGLLGTTLTMYKGNFYNATTVSAGASVASNQTMYGHEDFAMLLAGVGNKTGYNFEVKDGKFIIQPNLLLSYTFVNTFDYTNAAGVRINSDPLHAIQIAPSVKFIGNIKGGWQPYASVGMVWNLLDKSDVHANDVRLPEMSVKPYVQYGVGLQKRFKDDRYMAFGQVMIQNGGRNGVSMNVGFRWALGREGAPIEKTQRSNGNFNASLPTQNRFISSDINGKNWATSSEKTTFGRPMGSAANIPNDERPQNVFGL